MNNVNENIFEDEIDLKDIINILLDGKWIIVAMTTFFSIVGVLYSLSMPNMFESKALLVSSSPTKQPSLMQNYGTLATLAGIDMSEGSETNAMQAIEKLNSLSFFESSILPNIFLPDLMALKSWNAQLNELQYNNKIYDISSETWIRDVSYPKKIIPSAQESFDIFKGHLNVELDEQTNFLTVKIKHQSPHIAKEWTLLIIDQINSFYREKDKNEAERASNYLNSLLSKTNLSEIKQAIATLLQQETQKLTLIEANEFYVYEFIDPPVVMERKSEPNRAIICIIAAIIGGILGSSYVFVRHYLFKKESKT